MASISTASTLLRRQLRITSPRTALRCYASISDPSHSQILDASNAASSSSPVQTRRQQHASPQERRTATENMKERKFRQYEKMLKAKAVEEGLSSIEELAAKRKAQKDASVAASLGLKPPPRPTTPTEQRDADMAAKIRAAAEKEAKRKLASGDFSSNPHTAGGKGDSPIKPLGSILDLSKIHGDAEMTGEKIKELWTGYHSLKGKLSAAIPTETYERLIGVARRYPQFVLPLPRTIVGDENDAEGDVQATNLKPGEKKQGYEMQFLEWGFLPPAAPQKGATPSPPAPSPTTVLFTPLAEYKLRQEFAQPLLILTHYTDLARSHGLVLMRGDVTSAEEIEANPTGVAAAEAAKSRGASQEEQDRLKLTPVQTSVKAPAEEQGGSGAKMSEKDAQLLAMTMQRFYLPVDAGKDAAAKERQELLKAFHEDKDAFSVPRLCEVAFTF